MSSPGEDALAPAVLDGRACLPPIRSPGAAGLPPRCKGLLSPRSMEALSPRRKGLKQLVVAAADNGKGVPRLVLALLHDRGRFVRRCRGSPLAPPRESVAWRGEDSPLEGDGEHDDGDRCAPSSETGKYETHTHQKSYL